MRSKVAGELVTEREQLDADLVGRDPVLVLSPALRGERWRDQRGGAADSGDGGSGGHPAQEVTAVDERDLVFRAEVVFLIGVHVVGIGIWFSGPGAERLLLGLVSERKRTFDQLFRSLQNPRAAVNAVLGFSRGFGRVLGLRVAGPGARKRTAIRPDDAMRCLLMHKF